MGGGGSKYMDEIKIPSNDINKEKFENIINTNNKYFFIIIIGIILLIFLYLFILFFKKKKI